MTYNLGVPIFYSLFFCSIIFFGCSKKDTNMKTITISYDSSEYAFIRPVLWKKDMYKLINKIKKEDSVSFFTIDEYVQSIRIKDYEHKKLSEDIYKFRSIEELDIFNSDIAEFPRIEEFIHISSFSISGNSSPKRNSGKKRNLGKIVITDRSQWLKKLEIRDFIIEDIVFAKGLRITDLILVNCELKKIPATLCNLRHIQVINLCVNPIKDSTFNFGCLAAENLRSICIETKYIPVSSKEKIADILKRRRERDR